MFQNMFVLWFNFELVENIFLLAELQVFKGTYIYG